MNVNGRNIEPELQVGAKGTQSVTLQALIFYQLIICIYIVWAHFICFPVELFK